jgi:magnesium-transporting ATPase (P-type)
MRSGLVMLVMVAGAFWLFNWELTQAGDTLAEARTAVVNVIVLVELVYLFNCRSLQRPCFAVHFLGNGWAFAGATVMFGAQLLFTYTPLMNRLFHTAPIGSDSWWRIFAVAGAVFGVVEFEKWIRYGRARGEHSLPE